MSSKSARERRVSPLLPAAVLGGGIALAAFAAAPAYADSSAPSGAEAAPPVSRPAQERPTAPRKEAAEPEAGVPAEAGPVEPESQAPAAPARDQGAEGQGAENQGAEGAGGQAVEPQLPATDGENTTPAAPVASTSSAPASGAPAAAGDTTADRTTPGAPGAQAAPKTQAAPKAQVAAAQGGKAASPFPITETFAGSTAPGWTLQGNSQVGGGSLSLTQGKNDQKSIAVLDQAFPAKQGFTVEFDYVAYGGQRFTDGHTGNENYGDGFSVFLLDGSKTTAPGAQGPGLAYSCVYCSDPKDTRPVRPGVTGGHLGVGFDEFGGYASGTAGHGHGPEPFGGWDNAPGFSPDTVTVRGSGDGTTGFNYLTGSQQGVGIAAEKSAPKKAKLVYDGKGKLSVYLDGKQIIKDYDVSKANGRKALPDTLKLGFGASTGGASRNYEISNVKISVSADVAVTKTGPAKVTQGDKVTYVLTITNRGPSNATGVTVKDTVPSAIGSVTYTCVAAGASVCGTGSSGSGNSVDAKVDVAVGDNVVITINGKAVTAGSVKNTAT
ncbi:MAG TPA: hypothetical protein VIU15_00850, partial [Streptomyces sp.]